MSGPDPGRTWRDALMVADLLAVDPQGLGGVVLRGPPGPARDAVLGRLRAGLPEGAPWLKLQAQPALGQLLGGLDLQATLALGAARAERGLLARADGGALVIAMAERLPQAAAAVISAALETGRVCVERDGLAFDHPARFFAVALDEGAVADEAAPAKLAERLAFALDLSALTHRDLADADSTPAAIAEARARLPFVQADADVLHALTEAALNLGVGSLRAPLLALRAARAAAALAGRSEIASEDAALAARLVLGPRALALPAPSEEPDAPPPPQPDDQPDAPAPDPDQIGRLDDVVLAAALAAIPKDLLARLKTSAARRASSAAQGAGELQASPRHGRPIGARRGDPSSGARLDLLATLRAAAPWQRLRRRAARPELADRPILFARDDLHLRRFKERRQAVTVFLVDASGSTAAERLAEAKGAVEMLLADCYVRRDEAALIAFRGHGAELLLPPTRALQRARRELAGLPGGGGTPLAAGLIAAGRLADELKRKGRTPTLVLITDGRANVTRAGTGGRAQAQAEAEAAAKALRAEGHRAIVIDNSPRPEPKAKALADHLGGLYLALPRADARTISAVAKAQSPDLWSGRR